MQNYAGPKAILAPPFRANLALARLLAQPSRAGYTKQAGKVRNSAMSRGCDTNRDWPETASEVLANDHLFTIFQKISAERGYWT